MRIFILPGPNNYRVWVRCTSCSLLSLVLQANSEGQGYPDAFVSRSDASPKRSDVEISLAGHDAELQPVVRLQFCEN